MRVAKITLWGLGLAVLLALLGTAYLLVYLERNKALVESVASEALGREVRIDKGISLRWSMRPAITLQGLWIGNPAWARGEYLARADQAFVRFDVAALLGGHLRVDELVLQQADVALETAEDGRRNWDFGGGSSMLPSPSIDRLAFKKSHLRYQSADGKAQQFAFSTLELLGLGNDAPSVTASGLVCKVRSIVGRVRCVVGACAVNLRTSESALDWRGTTAACRHRKAGNRSRSAATIF